MFREIELKRWAGNNFETSEDRKRNKIIIKESVMCWKDFYIDRCNVIHDEEDQKKRLTQWNGNVLDEMMNGERDERTHVESTKLEIEWAQNKNIRS